MGKKDVKLLIILAIIIAVFCFIRLIPRAVSADSVRISQNGEVIGIYSLFKNTTIDLSHNRITIQNGKVYMEDADCPDKSCINQGAITHTGETIACLPNRVIVEIIGKKIISGAKPVNYSGIHFDTLVNVTVYNVPDGLNVSEYISKECEKYELICSRTLENSELYGLNNRTLISDKTVDYNGRNIKAYKVSDELYTMISKGKEAYEESDGRFDIAIARLTSLWDFKSGNAVIPDKAEIENALPCLSANDIILCDNGYIAFTNDETMIDLGGLAKGYIADSLKTSLISKGVKSAVISLGGNVALIGDKSGKPFNVGVRKPFSNASAPALTIKAGNVSVVTSGTYERYFIKDNKLYHHILNPNTGFPYETDLSGVTIICDSSIDGDILSTTLLSLGSKEATAKAQELKNEGIYVILMDEKGNVIYNSYNG